MRADVTVITTAIPERLDTYLPRAMASVAAQTLPPMQHLVAVDYDGWGPAVLRNALVAASETEWLAFLDDDDLFLPDHLETLLAHEDEADVIHSAFAVRGRPYWSWEDLHAQGCSTLEPHNTIPTTALVRKSFFDDVRGFRSNRPEDHNLWRMLRAAGARFVCVHERTWVYRFHGANASIARERDGRTVWGMNHGA